MLAVDPISEDPHITIAKVKNPDRNETIKKWLDSGFLDDFDTRKDSIAALYEAQAKQFLK